MNTPRGIRNNNPGNIDRGHTTWQGMSEDQSGDPRFIVFDGPEWGLRAIARLLKTYRRTGVDTVREIINRWAPPRENDTDAYVIAVAKTLGIGPDETVTDEHLIGMMQAIVKHENGEQPYDLALYEKSVQLEKA